MILREGEGEIEEEQKMKKGGRDCTVHHSTSAVQHNTTQYVQRSTLQYLYIDIVPGQTRV